MSDSLIRRLGELPVTEPDITRAEHIRKRCHAHLARHKRRSLIPSLPASERMVLVWQSLIAVLGFVYLTQAIRFALGMYDLT
jgi:hypothetical protein